MGEKKEKRYCSCCLPLRKTHAHLNSNVLEWQRYRVLAHMSQIQLHKMQLRTSAATQHNTVHCVYIVVFMARTARAQTKCTGKHLVQSILVQRTDDRASKLADFRIARTKKKNETEGSTHTNGN